MDEMKKNLISSNNKISNNHSCLSKIIPIYLQYQKIDNPTTNQLPKLENSIIHEMPTSLHKKYKILTFVTISKQKSVKHHTMILNSTKDSSKSWMIRSNKWTNHTKKPTQTLKYLINKWVWAETFTLPIYHQKMHKSAY